jgi:hypothetical protein
MAKRKNAGTKASRKAVKATSSSSSRGRAAKAGRSSKGASSASRAAGRKKTARPAAKKAGKKAAKKAAKATSAKAVKKVVAKKAVARKAAAKKAPPRKAVKKAAAKAAPKKVALKKAAPKATPKPVAAKKAAPKKAATPAPAATPRAAAPAPATPAPKKTTKRAASSGPRTTTGKRAPANAVTPMERAAGDPVSIPSSLDLESSAKARSGQNEMREHLRGHNEASPALTAGDVDADWEQAYSSGDEAPGGDNPTPDQDVVDEIGHALGVEYDDNEELKGADKISERDKHRWELDPASSEGYPERGEED